MTRINVGVRARELCDQHLVAEYRELPRVCRYVVRTQGRAPDRFCLGRGHVLWCAVHPSILVFRYRDLVEQMRRRGFTVRYPDLPISTALSGPLVSKRDLRVARTLVIERLRERMCTMSRDPRWSKPASVPRWWRQAANDD